MESNYKCILSEQYHKQLHADLKAKWGNWYGGCTDAKFLPPNVTLHVAAMDDADSYENLRKALTQHGISRVFELREWGCGYEIDVEIVGFTYTGAEGFWTNGECDWMVYASHEASLTFGGAWLIEKMRNALPQYNRYIYKGWDLAAYDS